MKPITTKNKIHNAIGALFIGLAWVISAVVVASIMWLLMYGLYKWGWPMLGGIALMLIVLAMIWLATLEVEE